MPPPDPPTPKREGNGQRGAVRHVCAITGKSHPLRDLVLMGEVGPVLAARMLLDHPRLAPDALVSRDEVARYRARYIAELLTEERGELSELDRQVTESLARQETLAENVEAQFAQKRTLGERLSDGLATFGGSWSFLISFGVVLLVWIGLNVVYGVDRAFDPYPFILLNLVLSCVAAIQAPIIMMSQKRQETKDRLRSENDYKVNLKAELEIRHLHEKLDHLLTRQWQRMTELQQLQLEILQELNRNGKR
jgi:uncharacterized membrane protein